MRSVKIQLLEKERGNSGRNRTIKMISSYTTNNNTETQTECEIPRDVFVFTLIFLI